MCDHLLCFCSYNSGRTSSAFLDFINTQLKGDNTFARIESLDTLAKKYIGAGESCRVQCCRFESVVTLLMCRLVSTPRVVASMQLVLQTRAHTVKTTMCVSATDTLCPSLPPLMCMSADNSCSSVKSAAYCLSQLVFATFPH